MKDTKESENETKIAATSAVGTTTSGGTKAR